MPFGCAVGAFELFIFYPFFTESNPAIHPFGVALCFAHVAQRVDAYAVEEPEIARVLLNRDAGGVLQQVVIEL